MVRIFGRDVAELPLVATRYKNRGKVHDCTTNLIDISQFNLSIPTLVPFPLFKFFLPLFILWWFESGHGKLGTV